MASKSYKTVGKKLATFILIFSLLTSVISLPVFTPRAHAFLGIGDFGITIDVKALLRAVVDGIAMRAAQKMVDDIVKSTVTWANTGFDGGPAYVTDAPQFFGNLADGIAGSFIEGSDLNFLCSPFQNSIRLSLARNYYQPPSSRYQCTLTGTVGNIQNFYDHFDGGWGTWFAMTQNDTSNPYGAFLEAKSDLDYRIAAATDQAKTEYTTNQGYLSLKECAAYNPSQSVIDDYYNQDFNDDGTFANNSNPIVSGKVRYDPTKPAGACIQDGAVKTAGTTIKAQIDRVLPSGLEKLISVQHVEQLVGAFANGLLNRYVFGPKGLFGNDYADHFNKSNDPNKINEPDVNEFIKTLPGYGVPTGSGGSGGTGATNGNPTCGGAGQPSCGALDQLSCSSNVDSVVISSDFANINYVTWSVDSDALEKNFPNATYTYQWEFDNDAVLLANTTRSQSVYYTTPGTKSARVNAISDTSGQQFTYAQCSNYVDARLAPSEFNEN